MANRVDKSWFQINLPTSGQEVTDRLKSVPGRLPGILMNSVSPGSGVINSLGSLAPGVSNLSGQVQDSNLPQFAKTSLAGAASTLDAFEVAQTTLNTGVAGTVMLAGDTQVYGVNQFENFLRRLSGQDPQDAVYANPLMRDGWQMSDVTDTYKRVWDGRVTPGQAIATTFGRKTAQLVDFVVPGDLQSKIDEWVLESADKALDDPDNTRGLLAWNTGLHSEFDIYDEHQRDSAYNQGVGRWITGASDAAIMWWAAPDIIVAKGAGWAGRNLLTKSIDSLADVEKATVELAQHRAWANGEDVVTVNGQVVDAAPKRTSIGRLAESLIPLNEAQAAEHAFAQSSTNKTLVARLVGGSNSYEELEIGIRGLLSDMSVLGDVERIYGATIADTVSLNARRAEDAKELLRLRKANEEEVVSRFGESFATSEAKMQAEVDRLQRVIDDALGQNTQLKDAWDLAKSGTFDTGIAAVRFGNNKKAAIRLARFDNFGGPNTAAAMAAKAVRKADIKSGVLFKETTLKTGGSFGRTVRIFRSAVDYMQTYRAMGRVNISMSSDELYDELASIMTTNPMFRRLMRATAGQADETLLGVGRTAAQFREYWLGRAVQAADSTQRLEVIQAFQNEMLTALRAEYGISASKAREIVNEYKKHNQRVADQMDRYGWFKDGDEIIAVPDMQSKMGESVALMDFNFLETIFRLDRGGSKSKSIAALADDKASGAVRYNPAAGRLKKRSDYGAIAKLDGIWRPLVLARLGYTQRNVAEGMLRELAAFGQASYFRAERNMSTLPDNMTTAQALGYRVAATKNKLKIGGYRRRAAIRRASQALDEGYEELSNATKALTAEEKRLAAATARARKIAADADARARRNLTAERVAEAERHVGATYERVEGVAQERMDEIMSEATDIYVAPSNVRPLYRQGGRPSKSVSGYTDEADVALAENARETDGVLDPIDTYADFNVDDLTFPGLSKWLPESERPRLAEVIYSQPGTPEYDELLTMVADASISAARHAQYRGNAVVRIKGNGHYEVIHSLDEIMIDDLTAGRIAVLPNEKFTEVQYVKAKVYGDILDLRFLDNEGSQKFDDLDDIHWTRIPQEPNEKEYGGDITESIFTDAMDDYATVLASDPDLVRAANLATALRRLKLTHPDIYELAEKKGLLSYSGALRKALDRQRKARGNREEIQAIWEQERNDFIEQMNDPEFLETIPELEAWMLNEEALAFHGGRIPGDELGDIPVTEQSVGNYAGSAYLYATAEQWMGTEYALTKAFDENGVAKVYMVDNSYDDVNFINLDEKFIDPETGIPNQDTQDLAMEWLDRSLADAGVDVDDIGIEEAFSEVMYYLQQRADREAFGNVLGGGTSGGLSLKEFREGIQHYIYAKKNGYDPLQVGYDFPPPVEEMFAAQESIRQAALDMGAVGLRHTGGKNRPSVVYGEVEHQVYVYYVKPDVTPIESLTPDMMRLQAARKRLRDAHQREFTQDELADTYEQFFPYDPTKWDASQMTPRTMDILTQLANEAGYGSVRVSDTLAPSGQRIITRPDQMSIGSDNIDDVIPGGMLEKNFVDEKFPELVHEELLADQAVFTGRDPVQVQRWVGNEEAANWIVNGGSTPSPAARAAIARAMEGSPSGGYSHVQLGDGKILSASELIGNKRVGAAYGSMLEYSDVRQEAARLLRGDARWQAAKQELDESRRSTASMQSSVKTLEGGLKEHAAVLKKYSDKALRKNPKRGAGKERFVGQFSQVEIDGPLTDQLWASATSSDTRNMLMAFGLSDLQVRRLVAGTQEYSYKPGDELYFEKVAHQLNRFFRRDPAAEAMLANPNIVNDDALFNEWVAATLIPELSKTQRGRAWLRDQAGLGDKVENLDRADVGVTAIEDGLTAAQTIRQELLTMLPVRDDQGAALWRRIADGDISAYELKMETAWRSDLGAVKDIEMIMSAEHGYRKAVSKIMHTLGTLPEDHLVRHPFFRARWREEMQRQLDLYSGQKRKADPNWDGFFTDEEVSQMSLVAKQWGVKSTNETLYTIQRISTPAHMMRFIAPFFPAWASSARFWLYRMPFEKPENVIRYSYIFDAPARIGALENREGEKVEGRSNPIARVASKFQSDDDNMVVVQLDGRSAKWVEGITQGQSRIAVSRGSLDMMLQGDTFWLPGFGPLMTIPMNFLASRSPDVAEAIRTGRITNGANETVDQFAQKSGIIPFLTRAVYESALPFGPSKEKDITDMATEAVLPGIFSNFYKKMRGTDSASFSNTAMSIYRDDIVEWEQGGRLGPPPQFQDAVAKTQTFYWWRVGISAGAPFAPSFQSENQFYVNQWRAIEKETYDNGGSYDDALNKFIGQYGSDFFAYTQSLSGSSSGMSAQVGEYKEYNGNTELYAGLANLGDDASFMTMASRGVTKDGAYNDDGFDPAVYAWQFNRSVEGASGKFFRAGANQREDLLFDVSRQAGWYYYNKAMDSPKALLKKEQITEEQYSAIKQSVVTAIATKYRSWYESYLDVDGSRSLQSEQALDMIVSNEKWMSQHGDTPYARAMVTFQRQRKALVRLLAQREAAGGSSNIQAKSNLDIALTYEQLKKSVSRMDPTGEMERTIDRFFSGDDSSMDLRVHKGGN